MKNYNGVEEGQDECWGLPNGGIQGWEYGEEIKGGEK